jgi:hypothetical protein
MALAALAILGQRSAHSFPIGPVIAEPEAKVTRNKNVQEIRQVKLYISKHWKNGGSHGDPEVTSIRQYLSFLL